MTKDIRQKKAFGLKSRFEEFVVNLRNRRGERRTSREHKAMRGGKKKNRQTEKRITKASIDSGRRSNDLRQTARELKGQGRGGERFPRVKSTYRLRSRRSSEFPVINYGVDDRVPPLFLLLLLPPPPRPFFFFLFFSFYLAPVRTRSPTLSHQCRAPLLFLLPLSRLSLLSPSFFFIHLTASRKRYAAYRGSVRTTCGPHS